MNYVFELNESIMDIMLDLRFLRGLKSEKVEKLENILTVFIDEWKYKDDIPKEICSLFMDFYPAVEACADNYNETEKRKILQFADKICELMRSCLDTNKQ